MNTPEHENHTTQLTAYALGALDLDELAEVEQLLARSSVYQEELRQLREVVGLLPFSAPPADPPPHIREQLLARITTSRQAVPADAAPASPKRQRFRWLVPAALAALAMLVLALGGVTFSLQQRLASLDHTNQELVATLALLNNQIGDAQARQNELASRLASSQDQIAQLNAKVAEDEYVIDYVSAPGVATRQLNAVRGDARGQMYMYPGNPNAVVLFSGLTTLAPGKVYQFWLADGAAQVAVGTFQVDADGIASLVIMAPREVNAFSQVMVTIEPDGGSAQPSADVVLEGSL